MSVVPMARFILFQVVLSHLRSADSGLLSVAVVQEAPAILLDGRFNWFLRIANSLSIVYLDYFVCRSNESNLPFSSYAKTGTQRIPW